MSSQEILEQVSDSHIDKCLFSSSSQLTLSLDSYDIDDKRLIDSLLY